MHFDSGSKLTSPKHRGNFVDFDKSLIATCYAFAVLPLSESEEFFNIHKSYVTPSPSVLPQI